MGWIFPIFRIALAVGASLLMFMLVWVVLSIKIVGPTERAIVVILGNPKWVRESGLCFVPWLLAQLVRYPTKQYRLDYVGRPVITAPGEYPSGSGQFHEAAEIKIDTTVYFQWPSGQDLIEAFRTAPPPFAPPPAEPSRVLFDFFEDVTVGAMRAVAGAITWREVTDNRDRVSQDVQGRLLSLGPYHDARISNFTLVIEEVQLPERLRELIIRPEEAELDRRAGEQAARLEGEQIRQRGRAYREQGILGRMFGVVFTLLDRGTR